MSFKISCSPHLPREGRSYLTLNLQFAPHPRSSFGKLANGSTATINPSDDLVPTLEATEYIAPGYLWDFWLGDHPQYGKVVLNPEYDDYVPEEQIIKEALKEEEMYLGPLADLQGELVPRYYGLYHSLPDQEHLAILLEYIDHPGGPGAMPVLEWKDKLYSVYMQLHLRGILHGDVAHRHILRDKQDRIRLVSFRRSVQVSSADEMDVSDLLNEYVQVRVMIGMERDEDIHNYDLPSAYWSKLPDPAGFYKELMDAEDEPEPEWMVEMNRKLREDPWSTDFGE